MLIMADCLFVVMEFYHDSNRVKSKDIKNFTYCCYDIYTTLTVRTKEKPKTGTIHHRWDKKVVQSKNCYQDFD